MSKWDDVKAQWLNLFAEYMQEAESHDAEVLDRDTKDIVTDMVRYWWESFDLINDRLTEEQKAIYAHAKGETNDMKTSVIWMHGEVFDGKNSEGPECPAQYSGIYVSPKEQKDDTDHVQFACKLPDGSNLCLRLFVKDLLVLQCLVADAYRNAK